MFALLWSVIVAGPAFATDGVWPDLSRPPAGLAQDGSRDVALIVAVENYLHPSVGAVPGARANALEWQAYLKSRGVGTVKLLTDDEATKENIEEQAVALAEARKSKGRVWFVFIGHGAPGSGGGTLVGVDAMATSKSLEQRGITPEHIEQLFGAHEGVEFTAIIDACFSGRSGTGAQLAQDGSMPLRGVEPPAEAGATLLLAAGSQQYAGPLPGLDRPAFSWLMLGALRGWGDTNRDGKVTALEARDWTVLQLLELVNVRVQTPEVYGQLDRTLALGKERAPDLSALIPQSTAARSPAKKAESLTVSASAAPTAAARTAAPSGPTTKPTTPATPAVASGKPVQSAQPAARAAPSTPSPTAKTDYAALAEASKAKIEADARAAQAADAVRAATAKSDARTKGERAADARSDWREIAPKLAQGADYMKPVVTAFVKDYDTVDSSEVAMARAWLGQADGTSAAWERALTCDALTEKPAVLGWCRRGDAYTLLDIGTLAFAIRDGSTTTGAQLAGYTHGDKFFGGFQLAGYSHLESDFKGGLQLGGVNQVDDDFRGVAQVGGLNVASDFGGFAQVGGVNLADKFAGFGQWGVVNLSESGFQLSQVGAWNGDEGTMFITRVGAINFSENEHCCSEAAVLANVVSGDAAILLVAPVNLVGGDMVGLQWSLIGNASEELHGIQVGGINWTRGDTVGFQAGFVNISDTDGYNDTRGAQLGTVNWSAGDFGGLQISFINVGARDVNGMQIGLLNYAGDLDGVQLGVININGDGFDVPIINIGE